MSARKEFRPNETADVVIVGGGVIGLTIARALALRGVRDVMLIERTHPGAEGSSAAAGILAPQVEADQRDDFFQLACASRDLYPAFAAALQDETGVDVELDTTGTLYFGFTPEDKNVLRRRHTWQTSAGLSVEWLDAGDAHQLEPNISDKVVCALRFPNDFQVDNRCLVSALVIANKKLGVRVVSECDAGALQIKRGKISGVETSLGLVSTPLAILAAGAWNSFIDSPGASLIPIRIEPVRGQMLCFDARPQIARHVLYSLRGYLVPRRDGRLLAGSTIEHVGFEKTVTCEGMKTIKSMALEIAPVLERLLLIDSWAGFRPRAEDGLPVLGPCKGIKGLVYATGHYRNGILLAPITGELIADAIVDSARASLPTAFSPERFRPAEAASLSA
jgi:glycine oxidase